MPLLTYSSTIKRAVIEFRRRGMIFDSIDFDFGLSSFMEAWQRWSAIFNRFYPRFLSIVFQFSSFSTNFTPFFSDFLPIFFQFSSFSTDFTPFSFNFIHFQPMLLIFLRFSFNFPHFQPILPDFSLISIVYNVIAYIFFDYWLNFADVGWSSTWLNL